MSVLDILLWLGLSSLVATALVGGVLLLRGPVTRAFGANAALSLWAAPGLRLVLPPLGLGLLAWPGAAPDAVQGRPAAPTPPEPVTAALPYLIEPSAAVPANAPPLFAVPPTEVLLLSAWLLGAALALGAGWLSTASWRRTLLAERSEPTSPTLAAELADAKREAGYSGQVDLVVTSAAASPQVIGFLSPVIAVPSGFADAYSPAQRRLALLHECVHLARRDLWTLALAEALCALHWFNPLLRRSLRDFRADQEAACDEAVRRLGAPVADYAGTLLHAARGPLVPALTLNHDLSRRIKTMTRPMPKTVARLAGTASVLAIALGAAAATQERANDPNAVPEADRKAERREVSVWEWSDDDGKSGGFRMERGGETDMVLLSDPFAALMPERPRTPKSAMRVRVSPPTPPKPPVPEMRTPARVVVVGEDGAKRTIDLAPGERLETEDGTAVIVPPTLPDDFEVRMDAFEVEMDEWSEEFEAEFGEEFEREMSIFGEEMGAWGEKMGAVGEAVGELAERCEDHRESTVRPTVLEARVEGTGEVVKAVCARGGEERYASVEMERFVERQRGLSAEEKAAFLKNRGRGGITVSR